MITKAKILQLPKGSYTNDKGELVVDNKFKIYVPIFRRAGEPENNPSGASIMYATLCYNPGAENGYRVGDVVYISFENNQMGEPIILGKLFLNNTQESENTTYLIGDELNISKSAKLPMNTTIGDVKLSNIENLFQQVGVLYDNTISIEEETIKQLQDYYSGNQVKTLPFLKEEYLKALNLLDWENAKEYNNYSQNVINVIGEDAWGDRDLRDELISSLQNTDLFVASDYISAVDSDETVRYTCFGYKRTEELVYSTPNDCYVLIYYLDDYDNYVYYRYDKVNHIDDLLYRDFTLDQYDGRNYYIKVFYCGGYNPTHHAPIKLFLIPKGLISSYEYKLNSEDERQEVIDLFDSMNYNGKIIHEKQLDDALKEAGLGGYNLLFTFDFQHYRWDSEYASGTNPPYSNMVIDWYTLSQYKYITIWYFENAQVVSTSSYGFITAPKKLTITNYDSSYFSTDTNSGIRINLSYTPGYMYNPSTWVRSLYIIYNVGLTTGKCYRVGNSTAVNENYLVPYKIYGHNNL